MNLDLMETVFLSWPFLRFKKTDNERDYWVDPEIFNLIELEDKLSSLIINNGYTPVKSHQEIKGAKDELDKVQGEIECIETEIALEKKEKTSSEEFTYRKGVVYGPLGWALLIVEWTLKELYIVCEY